MATTTNPAPVPTAVDSVRRTAIATIVGFVVVAAGVTGLSMLFGEDPIGSLGVGAFVGSWGGAGFGFMMGATQAAIRSGADGSH